MDAAEIESEVLAECDAMDAAEREEMIEQAEIDLTFAQFIRDTEAKAFHLIKAGMEKHKLVPPEYLDRFKIVLHGGDDWNGIKIRVNTANDPYVYYVFTYKLGELHLLFDTTRHGQFEVLRKWMKHVGASLVGVWRKSFTPFEKPEVWVKMAKNRRLFKQHYKKDARELFDILELGRLEITYHEVVTIKDKYSGYTETREHSGKAHWNTLNTAEQLAISERLRAIDTERFAEAPGELIDKQLDEFITKENLK